MPDAATAELRADWWKRLTPFAVFQFRHLRAFEGNAVIAAWAEQAALEARLIWDCGRPR